MKHSVWGCLLALILLPFVTLAQETNSPLDQLKKAYGKARSATLETHNQQKAEALKGYGRTLETLMESLKKKGDLDGFLVVQTETARFRTEQTAPEPAQTPDLLLQPVGDYYKKIAALNQEDDSQTARLLKQYGAALDDLIRKLMLQDRIEEAKAVKEEKDKAALVLADLERRMAASAPASGPASGVAPAEPAPSAPAPKPVLWNSLGNRIEIESGRIGPGATLYGQPSFQLGKEGMALLLKDGCALRFPPSAIPGFNGPGAIEFWMRTPDRLDRQLMLLWNMQGPGQAGLNCSVSPKDQCLTAWVCNAAYDDLIRGDNLTPPLQPNRWYHVAFVWDWENGIDGTDAFRVYLDGSVTYRNTQRRSGLNAWGSAPGHANFMLGAQGYGGKVSDEFGGVIDEFKCWDRVVTSFAVAPRNASPAARTTPAAAAPEKSPVLSAAEQKAAAKKEAREKAKAFQAHRYLLVETPMNWRDAKAACEGMGGHLVSIGNKAENEFIRTCGGGRTVWLGVIQENRDKYTWVDGASVRFTCWAPGEPWGKDAALNAGAFHRTYNGEYGWSLRNGDDANPFVCEWDY